MTTTIAPAELASLWDALEAIAPLTRRGTGVRWRIDTLVAIDQWARAQLHIADGDRVVIVDAPVITHDRNSGWWPWRDMLVNGAVGQVRGIDFNSHIGAWQAVVHFDADEAYPQRVFAFTAGRLGRIP